MESIGHERALMVAVLAFGQCRYTLRVRIPKPKKEKEKEKAIEKLYIYGGFNITFWMVIERDYWLVERC